MIEIRYFLTFSDGFHLQRWWRASVLPVDWMMWCWSRRGGSSCRWIEWCGVDPGAVDLLAGGLNDVVLIQEPWICCRQTLTWTKMTWRCWTRSLTPRRRHQAASSHQSGRQRSAPQVRQWRPVRLWPRVTPTPRRLTSSCRQLCWTWPLVIWAHILKTS